MSKRNYCHVYLTCESTAEASKIANALLEQRLIVCAKQLPVKATYWWESKVTSGQEVLLIMESAQDLFNQIEVEVEKLHSYDTFVLEAVSIAALSHKAEKWMEENLYGEA